MSQCLTEIDVIYVVEVLVAFVTPSLGVIFCSVTQKAKIQDKRLLVLLPAVVANLHHRSYKERRKGGSEHSFVHLRQCFRQT